jgi:tripartite-type tricarboxylate transporter receptor subunit TctC
VNRITPAASRRRFLWAAAALLAAPAAIAQTYPSKPVQMLTPFSPGNTIDLQARATAEELRKIVGQQVVVVNKEGAAGMIGFAELTRAAPDGYTILFAPNGPLTLQPHVRKSLPFDPAKVDPVCALSRTRFVVVVGEKSPFRSLADLIAAARKAPGKLNWGVSGIGSIPHLQWHMVEKSAGIETTPVAYKNYALVAPETVSGQLDFSVMAIGSFANQPLRLLAVVDERRASKYPDLPTAKELGYAAAPAGHGGIYVPVGLPPEIQAALGRSCAEVAQSPALRAAFDRLGVELVYLDAGAFAAALAADYKIKGAAARELNLQVE